MKKKLLDICKHCGYWVNHSTTCSRHKGETEMLKDTPTNFYEYLKDFSLVEVATAKPKKVTVEPIDPKATISIELVDKRHIVLRRWSSKSKMCAVNLHYPVAEKATSYLQEVLAYAKKVSAEIIEEANNAYRFNGLSGKLVIKDTSFGTRIL